MGCCGRKNRVVAPKATPDQQKIIDIVKSRNYGAIKKGRGRVTATTKQCLNCNTLVSSRSICPICGHKV